MNRMERYLRCTEIIDCDTKAHKDKAQELTEGRLIVFARIRSKSGRKAGDLVALPAARTKRSADGQHRDPLCGGTDVKDVSSPSHGKTKRPALSSGLSGEADV